MSVPDFIDLFLRYFFQKCIKKLGMFLFQVELVYMRVLKYVLLNSMNQFKLCISFSDLKQQITFLFYTREIDEMTVLGIAMLPKMFPPL